MQINKIRILSITNLIGTFLLTIFMVNCGLFSGFGGKEGDNPFLFLLGFGRGGQRSVPIPEYRVNGFLRNLDSQPLRTHGLEKSGIIHLTNSSGMFSLYLNSGRHTIQVSDPSGSSMGSFSFTLETLEVMPEIEYSGDVAFQVVWEDLIALPQNTIDPTVGQAEVVINEVAPGITSANGGDVVELFVTSGGNLLSSSICVRNICADIPEVRVRSGEFILLREGDGVNDAIISDGPSSTAWDFYGLPSMTTTDSIVFIRTRGVAYASVLKYANNNQVWNGCNGTSGNVACIPPILNAGQWSQAGEEFDESDAILRVPAGNFGNNDTIIRCPIGTTSRGRGAFIFSSSSTDRTFGNPNTSCPQFSLISTVSENPTTVIGTYNRTPNSNAGNSGNYAIYEGGSCSGDQLTINSVSLSGSTVTIRTEDQKPGINYTLCISNVTAGAESEPLSGNMGFFTGFAPTAQLTLNEIAPGLPNGTDYVEMFVLDGGSTAGLRLCNRTNCTNFPERIVEAGQYIVFYAGVTGANDITISDGASSAFWEFYGAQNMETTDSIVTIRSGDTIQSAVAYADGSGSWSGGTFINTVVAQGRWSQAGGSWAETDAQMKTPPASFGVNDTLIKIPNGTGSDSLSTWTVSTNQNDRTIGFANSPPLPPPTINTGDIVINELRRRSNGHFLELRNNTGTAIDLNAGNVHFYRAGTCNDPLNTTSWTNKFRLNGVIPPNGFYLVTSLALGIGENQVTSHSYGSNACAILTKSSLNPTSITDSSVLDAVGWGTSSICKGTCAVDLADNGVLRRTSSFQSLSSGNNLAEFTFNPACAGTPGVDNSTSGGCVPLGSVPTFSLAAGWHPSPTSTNITTTGADTIRYTMDGSTPTCHANGVIINGNSGSVNIDISLTIRAVSCKAGVASAIGERSFIIGGTPPPSLAGIFFNEFRRKSGNHWFELYNSTGSSIDLDAANAYIWRRAGCNTTPNFTGTSPLKLTGTISANGYYLVAVIDSDVNHLVDQTTTTSGVAAISDNNCIALTNSSVAPSGPSDISVQDFVGWGGANLFRGTVASNPPDNGILRRFPNGANTNNNANDFGTVSSCDGTPRSGNTSTCPDFTPPTVASTTPANNATNVSVNTTVQITFSEPMNASSITTNTSNSTCSGSIRVSTSSGFGTCVQMSSITQSGNTWTLTPNSTLGSDTIYYIQVTTAVQDLAGNNMVSSFSSQFTTGTPPPPPTNLIVNGSFEDDTNSCSNSNTASPPGITGTCPNGWTIWAIDSGTRSFLVTDNSSFAQSGNRYMSMNHYTATFGHRVVASNCFPIDPTKEITMRGWARRSSTTNTAGFRFRIRIYDDSNCTTGEEDPSGANPTAIAPDPLDTWVQHIFIRTSTQLNGKPYARLFIEMKGAATPNLWIDNIEVTQP